MRLRTMVVIFLVIVSGTFAALLYKDTAELVGESTLIVTGVVESTVSFYGDDGLIYSRAFVSVDNFLMGDDDSPVVEVVYPGGVIGDEGMTTSISPHFKDGMEVVLFLKTNDDGEYVLTNHAGSKFTVVSGTVLEKGITLEEYITEIALAVNK